jgi:hypothetical protein
MTGNASVFRSIELVAFYLRFGITLAHSANYYPQGNGLEESSNKNLIRIIRSNVVYVVSRIVSARVRNVTSRQHRQKMSKYVGKCRKTSKKYKNTHFFHFC